MTLTQRIILGVFGAINCVWIFRHVVLSIIFRLQEKETLTLGSPRFAGESAPLVTAIIPAKDEEATLADCLESVRRQGYPNLEILVVDDRSQDRTAEIAAKFAELDPRIRLISIDHLPNGWTGKTHALHMTARHARGDWFWFLDADTRHHPDSLSIMFEYARANGAAFTSLIPRMRCESFWENVVQPLAGIVLMRSFPPFLVNWDRCPLAFANGQYILVERSAYEAAGGHKAVRDRFVEDIHLAKRIKSMGYPIRVALSREISSTRMYTSLEQIVRGWSRILYDALGRNPIMLMGKALEPLIYSQSGYIALLAAILMIAMGTPSGPFPLWMLALGLVHLGLSLSVLYRMYRLSAPTTRYVAHYPLAGLVLDVIILRSLWMCVTGKVTWRGTAYAPSAATRGPRVASSPHVGLDGRRAGDAESAAIEEL